jgi:copper(I)-binding protein
MKILAALAFILLALPASAHHYELGALKIGHVWGPVVMPKQDVGVVYFPIENTGTEDDALLSATTADADSVEFHETKIENGIAKMRKLNQVALPAGQTVELKQGGLHAMLLGMKKPKLAGEHIMLTLRFAKAGSIDVDAHVEPRASDNADHHSHH